MYSNSREIVRVSRRTSSSNYNAASFVSEHSNNTKSILIIINNSCCESNCSFTVIEINIVLFELLVKLRCSCSLDWQRSFNWSCLRIESMQLIVFSKEVPLCELIYINQLDWTHVKTVALIIPNLFNLYRASKISRALNLGLAEMHFLIRRVCRVLSDLTNRRSKRRKPPVVLPRQRTTCRIPELKN